MLDSLTLLRAMNGIHEEDVVMAGNTDTRIRNTNNTKKIVRITLLAAVLVSLLTAGAYAMGLLGIKAIVIPEEEEESIEVSVPVSQTQAAPEEPGSALVSITQPQAVPETLDSVSIDNTNDQTIDVSLNGETNTIEVAHMHAYTASITTDPTCTTDGEATYTCSICGDTYTEPIPATGEHIDEDNDGHCDTCEQQMTGGQHCKYCGKIHGGAFGWLVKFFHSIFAIFKR